MQRDDGTISEVADDGLQDRQPPDFIVAGLGASAGGLEALEEFFSHFPPHPGCALVLIMHLDPKHKSMLPDIFSRVTDLEVVQATEKATIRPDCVYIIPPDSSMQIEGRELRLAERSAESGSRNTIDHFFTSLAKTFGTMAAGIIFSGTGSDGTQGLKEIKLAGGVTMIQDPATATFGGMPASAQAAGVVDVVLRPAELARRLHAMASAKNRVHLKGEKEPASGYRELDSVLYDVHCQTGFALSSYKRSTLARRIEKRMLLREKLSIDDYRKLLADDKNEVQELLKEMYIGVTDFFRDAGAFKALEKDVIPGMLTQSPRDVVRAWVPGCATGEEAYSLAIAFANYLEATGKSFRVQIFATDINPQAIEKARKAEYPVSALSNVPEEYIRRFLVKNDRTFTISKAIREMVVFAEHDLISNPPFFKMDLISCRNLLIYLTQDIQKKLIQIFFHSLYPNGYLFLGPSEALGQHAGLFQTVSAKWKIFQRKDLPASRIEFPLSDRDFPTVKTDRPPETHLPARENYSSLLKNVLVQSFTPPSVMINEKNEIIQICGDVHGFLGLPEGDLKQDIFKMAREPLKMQIRSALRRTREQNEALTFKSIQKSEDGQTTVDLIVTPVKQNRQDTGLLVLSFRRNETGSQPVQHISEEITRDDVVRQLEDELLLANNQLKTTVEDLESANEELKSSNEELTSMNEELQSTNEELETSQEELQSLNEELNIVNSELQAKIAEADQARNDLENLLRSTDIATVFVDRNFIIKQFTPAASAIFNLMDNDIGRSLEHFTSKAPGADMLKEARLVLETETPREKIILTTEDRWFLKRIFPYRTLAGAIEGIVLTFVDITDRKHMEEELRRHQDELETLVAEKTGELRVSELRYRTLVSHFPNGAVLLFDQDLRFVLAHGDGLERVGLSPEDLVGKTVREAISPASADLLEPLYRKAIQGEKSRIELLFNGEVFDVWVLPVLNHNGEVTSGMVMSQIITERQRLEKALEESRQQTENRAQQLEATISSIADGVAIYDQDARIIMANQTARRLWGLEDEKLARDLPERRQNFGIQVNGREIPPDELPVARALKGETVVNQQIRFTRLWDGQEFWFLVSAAPIRMASGETRGVVLTLTDITEKVDYEQKLRSAMEEAKAASRAKDIFLSNMSHEIRTPLNGIIGFSKLMLMDQQQYCTPEHIQLIHDSGQQLLQIIDDLLDVSRLEAQTVSINPEPVCVRSLVDGLGKLHGTMAVDKGLRLLAETGEAVPEYVLADKVRLKQVLGNLLSNAVKFTQKGEIRLNAGIQSREDKPFLHFSVSDTGIGIPGEHRESVFERFYQVGNYLTREEQGTGLGLAISKRLVELMGGEIRLESEPGRGSTFSFDIPLVSVDKVLITPREIMTYRISPLKILLVEDNAVNRLYLRSTLDDAGMTVTEARNGQAALEILEQEDFDAVLMDIQMPVMDGVETTRRIRSSGNERVRRTKIIALTAYAMEEDQKKFLAEGMDGYVSKPADAEDVIHVLNELLKENGDQDHPD